VEPLDEPRFDLDFNGGTPQMLVDAAAKASKEGINVIIPEEHKDVRIPAMRMKRVTVSSLFEAVSEASKRTVSQSPRPPYGMPIGTWNSEESYGFRRSGSDNESPVWVFYYQKPVAPDVSQPKLVRFFQLGPYLDGPNGLKVEDITTAIQTGYSLLGESSTPELKFHKETRLLIAVGDQNRLSLIDEVLNSLPQGSNVTIDPTTGVPVPKAGSQPSRGTTPKRP
jgi:hypothetical protein